MKRILTLALSIAAFAVFGEARQDKAGLSPLYWVDLNGAESQWGSATLQGDSGHSGFRPLAYEPISYWGRKGCYSFNDARGQSFACGTGSFTMFVVARGGNDYSADDAVLFCLGRNLSAKHSNPALELAVRNPITDPSNVNSNLVAVRTWKSEDSPTDVLCKAVPGCYAAYRYVPYAIVYDAPSTTLKLYANGVEIASSTGGFTGFTESTCWWQIASVRGGVAGLGARDRCGITDFRYYTQALTAEQVATISSDYPLADQTGEMPHYHYAFNGLYRFYSGSPVASNVCQYLGSDRVRNNFNYEGNPTYYSNTPNSRNYFAGYSCEVMRDGVCAARSIPNSKDGYGDYWPLTNSFTFAISAKMDPASSVRNAVLVAFGSSAKPTHGGLAIVLRARGKIGLDYWDSNGVRQEGVTAYLGCTDPNHFHDIAVVHDRSAGTMALYVDGSCYGSFAHSGFTNSDEDNVHGCWQFGSIYGGNPSGFVASTAHTVEEFRFYTKALSQEQVLALSDAVPPWRAGTDPSGKLPHIHYTFNGAVASEGHTLLTVNGDAKLDEHITVNGYRQIRAGGAATAANVVSTSNYGGHFPVDRPFTLFMSADPGYYTENVCLFGIGAKSSTGIALMRRDLTTMAVGNWSSTAYPVEASVADGAAGAFHAYAVNVDPVENKVQLFVDGVAAGEPVALPHGLTDANWQFASVYGGAPSGIATVDSMMLEDFRVYVPALGASEIAALSAAYPAWCERDGAGNRPDYWYTFEPSGSVPKGAKILRDGATGYIRKPVGGDSLVRDGTFACTNIAAATGTYYGNAGGLQLGTEFSIFISARVKRPANVPGVIFSLGSKSDASTLAIASESNDKVSCYSYSSSGKTLLVQADVPGMQEDFNAYCVTWNGTTLALYLNGVEVASEATGANFSGFSSNPPWQISNIYGSIDSSILVAGVMTLEDFRVYGQALTAEQVASASAELPRWPRGALWQGGDSGSLSDAVWKKWDWSAAARGDWVTGRTLANGDNAAFGASETPLSLTGTGSPRLGELYIARPVALSGLSIACSSLEVAPGASFKPVGATLRSPGVRLAIVDSGAVSGIDFTVLDEYGNKYYVSRDGRKLYYGDGLFPGIMLIVK